MVKPLLEIELHDVTVHGDTHPERRVVRGVQWQIKPGDFWVVGGLAGSGKTILLETAAGLRPCTSGEVRLSGVPADRLTGDESRAARRRIGFIYGGGGRLLSHLTLAQNIALPLCYHRNVAPAATAEEVAALLSQFGLLSLADRLPGQVSPAYCQRAALARALALTPEVLFLDDPLAELNTAQARWWLRFLQGNDGPAAVAARPSTLVVATDDLRPWLSVGGQFALIEDGTWRALGGRDELANAREPLVRELLAEAAAAD